jgi:hypothetical protein
LKREQTRHDRPSAAPVKRSRLSLATRAASHYGKIELRKRLGSHVSDAEIETAISERLQLVFPKSPKTGRVSQFITRAAIRGELATETAATLGI